MIRSRDRGARRPARLGLLLVALFAGLTVPLSGQAGATPETEILREAAELEAAGELAAAESLLHGILEDRPASVPALLALDRLFRVQDRQAEMVPLLERAVADDPRSALVNQLRLRTYSALDRVRDLERAAQEWMSTVPRIAIAYQEAARVWTARGDYRRARSALEEGRRRMGRPDALALPMGDLHAAMGDYDLAVREWVRAVGPDARGMTQVRDRLDDLPGGFIVAPLLVELLAAPPTTPERLNAGLDLALDVELEERARGVLERLLEASNPLRQRELLRQVGRRADSQGMDGLAYWSFGRLLETEVGARVPAMDEDELLYIRSRHASLALALGDTAAAASSYRAVEDASAVGSPQRRAAAALRVELTAGSDPTAAAGMLAGFRTRYPDAPELDALTATVARALIGAGEAARADSLLVGVQGPRTALLRGRLLLRRGEPTAARTELVQAAPGLRGAEATRVIRLATLLDRISPEATVLVGEALAARDGRGSDGQPDAAEGDAVQQIEDGLERLRPGDVPPLLDFAAGLADESGRRDDALRLRRRLVSDHPEAAEAPAALLALGRELAGDADTRAEARDYLERLIIEHPRSALVPQARTALERLRAGGVV